jgi:hypothetical protein
MKTLRPCQEKSITFNKKYPSGDDLVVLPLLYLLLGAGVISFHMIRWKRGMIMWLRKQ